MRVDAHTHVWQRTDALNPAVATIVSPQCDVPPDLLEQYLEEHGIDRAVLVQPVYPGEDNSYVADAARRQPERFAAVCVVDPRSPDAAERLHYWVHERGCRGLRLRPRVADEAAAFAAPATHALWQMAERLGIAINVLAGPEHLPAVAQVAERFPAIPILLDHFAHPHLLQSSADSAALVLSLARFPSVHVKLSGYYYWSAEPFPYRDCWDLVRAVYDAFGPRRLVWGSDFPHVLLKTGYVRNLRLVDELFCRLTADDRRLILGENAAGLYWAEPR
jgi:predicted TIM-barrel fold metal-dependent hydrolase